MNHQAWISATAALTRALAACADRPLRNPTLTPLTAIERTMDCPQIDLAIDRADTVRWLIRDSGGKLGTSGDRAARYVGNVILAPLSLLARSPLSIGDSGHAVLNAADGRIRELLQLKRAQRCQPRATRLPGMHDLALLVELESVQAQLDAGTADEAVLFDERTRLLDALRIVPTAGTVSGEAAAET